MATGYPTPDEPSEIELQCWKVYLPNDPAFISILNGQMMEMTKTWFWKQDGDWSIDSIVEWMQKAVSATDIDDSGMCDDLTCEQIVDCIESNQDTKDALMQYLAENGYGTGSGTYDAPSVYNANPILADGSQIEDCNNDNLFGAITQLIDFMNSTLTDIFERVEAGSNYLERTQLLVSGIPAIGLLPIDEFVDFIDNIISSLAENYTSQYTNEIRDEYRCDLFCLCKDTCQMDFQQWTDYFMSRVGEDTTNENLSDGLEWFVTGVWEGTQIVHAAHALMCQVLAYGSRFFELDVAYLGRVITSAMNDPDPDWETLCEDCPDIWCRLFDFEVSNQSWAVAAFNPYGVYNSGIGWQCQNNGADNLIVIDRTFASSFTVIRMKLDWICTNAGGLSDLRLNGYMDNTQIIDGHIGALLPDGLEHQSVVEITGNINRIIVSCVTNTGGTSDTDAFTIKAITIEGVIAPEPPYGAEC